MSAPHLPVAAAAAAAPGWPAHADDPDRADHTLTALIHLASAAFVHLASAAFVHISNSRTAQADPALVEAVRMANAHIDGLFKP